MTVSITNDRAASFNEYTWEPGSVVDVDDETAGFLLSVKDSGFREAKQSHAEVAEEPDSEVAADDTESEVTDETKSEVAPDHSVF